MKKIKKGKTISVIMSIYQKLQKISPYLWFRYSNIIELLNLNALLKEFLNKHKNIRSMPTRLEYFSFINNEIILNQPITYLEFGVYKGESILTWAKLNKNDSSTFYGFDTFTGLPEDWTFTMKKGEFNLEGKVPKFDDHRIYLIKGLFQETLKSFLKNFERNNRLVIHLDADLYSSTLYVLSTVDQILEKGDILMFDEFSYPTGEFKAYIEWCSAFYRNPRMIVKVKGKSWMVDQVAFQIE